MKIHLLFTMIVTNMIKKNKDLSFMMTMIPENIAFKYLRDFKYWYKDMEMNRSLNNIYDETIYWNEKKNYDVRMIYFYRLPDGKYIDPFSYADKMGHEIYSTQSLQKYVNNDEDPKHIVVCALSELRAIMLLLNKQR